MMTEHGFCVYLVVQFRLECSFFKSKLHPSLGFMVNNHLTLKRDGPWDSPPPQKFESYYVLIASTATIGYTKQ